MKRAAGHLAIRLWAVLSLAGIATAAEQGRGTIQFDRDIRPILSESCFACHGPDGAKRKADLRLDTREGLFGLPKGGGRVVTPGQPNKSALLQRITSADKDELMPPPKTGKQLSAAQIALLHRWVEAGAPWSPGWAFTPPQLPKVPTVKQATWPRSDLDRFILAALEQRGWRPAPEADRVTLIRRLSYDLIGLPPTPEEVDAFLADTSPQAYESVVDRLLASKHFGERMAQHWLDLARYADSDGYHDDYLREMHGYRDYVIAAFNRNLPFDQFTIEQLAGDLLPNPTREQIVATAFNRNGPTTSENGADAEEYRLRYASERVNTTATVWLGLSLACAECHDHKYDPLTTRDYYQMFAFFDQVPGNSLANGAQAKPILRVVSPDMHDRLIAAEEELQRRQAALRKLYYEPRSDWDRAQAAWEQRMRDTKLEPMRFGDWWLSGPYVGPSGERFPPERAHVDGDRAAAKLFKWVAPPDAGTNEVKFAAREGITYLQRDVATTVGGIVRCRINTNVTAQVWLNERLVHASGRDAESPGTVKLFNVRVPPGRHRLLVKLTPVDMKAKGDITFGARESTAHRMRTETFKENKTFDIPWAKRSTNDATMVRRVFRELHVAEIDAAQNEVELAQERQTAAARGSSQMRIMAEGTNRVPTHILMRGDYRRKGELVHAAVPATLGSLPSDAKADRLALARWLTARDNPLTARVTVNRFWQMIFGTGIVKTSEDFGAQGEPPTHPELLDWLAVRFMDGGWDVKNMLRLIVTSATYRQSSQIPNSTDPENRWLARGPRFRLPAEFIRDTALAASGLLDRDRAPEGRSVLPYQPGPDLWREFAFAESLKYIQDHGEELYRRGVYMFWKRSVLHPYLAVMDAPTRDVCTARRPVTNTPTQALALLNETLLVECARVLAQRLLLAESLDNKARLTRAFRLVLARQPTERESAVLLGLHADSLRHYQADLAAAKKLVAVGESERPAKLDPAQHAAWLCVCNALLNLDEALTKE